MGKRELVLIVGFLLLGTVLYQVTAPPSPEGSGFSWRGMMDNIRRHVGPRHEYLADERTVPLPIDPATTEVRVTGVRVLHVEGTDEKAATASVQVYSTAPNEQEARALGKRTGLKTNVSGDILSLEFDYPPEERQRTTMTLKLPKRLRVRVRGVAAFDAKTVAGVELDDTRGEVTLTAIAGTIRGTHSGGSLTFEDVKDIDVTARRSDVTIRKAAGPVRFELTGGALTARDVGGAVTLSGNRSAIELEQVRGALKADLTQGSIEVTRLDGDARVDARGTEVRLELDRPAPVTAITTDENITVRVPEHAGFTLDAMVEDGEIRTPPGAPSVSTTQQLRRAQGPINGGGPTLALRTSHADIVIR